MASGLLPKPAISEEVFKDVSNQQGSSSSTRTRKRARGASREEILRLLAKDALEAMRGQGLKLPRDTDRRTSLRTRSNSELAWKKQRRGPQALFPSCGDKENVLPRPQSPNSFYREIGLHDENSMHTEESCSGLSKAPLVQTPEISKQMPQLATPDRAFRAKPDPDQPGSITPARVQAAKNLLSLMQ